MLEVDQIKEEIQLEKDRKEMVEWYIKNGLIEKCIDKNGRAVMSKEELDEWEWDE